MTTAKVNLASKLAQVHDQFVWHVHEDTDDFFLVLDGQLEVRLRERTVTLGPGELFVVPRGVEHGDPQTAAPRQEL